MSPSIVNSFIIGCVVLLVGVSGTLINSWMRGVKESNDKLTNAIDKLTNLITNIEKNQELHEYRIDQAEADIRALKADSHVFGRRAADVCRHPDCPIPSDQH